MNFLKYMSIDKKDLRLLKRSSKYLRQYKARMVTAFVIMVIGVILGLIQPYCFGKIVASVVEIDVRLFFRMVYVLIITYIIIHIFQFLQAYIFNVLHTSISFDVKRDMQKKVLDLPTIIFDKMRVGEFISRLEGDSGTISTLLTTRFLNSILDIMKMLIVGIAAIKMSWKLFIINLISLPFSYIISAYFGKILRKRNEQLISIKDTIFSKIQECIAGIREVKVFQLKEMKHNEFVKLNMNYNKIHIKSGITSAIMNVCNGIIGHFTELAVIGGGFYLIYKNEIKIEHYITFNAYAAQFFGSLTAVIGLNAVFQESIVSLGRIFDIMDNFNQTAETFGQKEVLRFKGDIKFNKIYFGYKKHENIYENFSLHIPSYKKVALVGRSGSGKSTLINLLLRHYDIDKGFISIDNINITELSEKSLRSSTSIVPQEPFFFRASLMENILIAKPYATEEDVINSCKSAYIHDFILNLPEKYETLVGERGINLSGGQKQRIAIARAILRGSPILIFDEATSSLDNESQYMIKKAINQMDGKKTIIIIAHRLYSVIDADIIYVLEKGRLVGEGNHQELIERNEIYNRLYKLEIETLSKRKESSSND